MNPSYLKEREAFISKAATSLETGKYSQAKAFAEERLGQFPGDVDAWLVLAGCAVKEGRYSDAHAILHDLDCILPGWPHIQECLGDMYLMRGMSAEAHEAYRRALNPDEKLRERIAAKVSRFAGTAEENDGEKTAADTCRMSFDFHTIALADLYLNQGHIDRARDIVQKILEEDPANIEAHRRMSRIEKLNSTRKA